jgi:hypothetical protein
MSSGEGFWWTMTLACMVWYSTITVYVAVRGAFDIRSMLKRLADINRDDIEDLT